MAMWSECLDNQSTVRSPLPAADVQQKVGSISLSSTDMESLSGEGELVVDSVVDAYLTIVQSKHPESFYFSLPFFQLLYTSRGYDFENVGALFSDVDIFSKQFVYFPIIFGAHYFLVVADMENKAIRAYDSMGTDRSFFMRIILTYLCDEFDHRSQLAPITRAHGLPPPIFSPSDWTFDNVFTPNTRIQHNGTDCGVYLMKFVELLPTGMETYSH